MKVISDRTSCITAPRPQPPPGIVITSSGACEVCMDPVSSQKFISYLLDVQRWMKQTELACKEPQQ